MPAIFPVVVYHGEATWLEPRELHALLAVPAHLRPVSARYCVGFEYLLRDLARLSEAELRAGGEQTALGALVELCFKYAPDGGRAAPGPRALPRAGA